MRNSKGQFIRGSKLGFQKGHKFGYKKKGNHTREWKKQMSLKMTGKKRPNLSGKNAWNWKGGCSPKYRIKNAPRPKPELCEICSKGGRICFDHDHKTGKFRGWICHKCNITMGLIEDDSNTLIKMIKYINKN